jgi:hypothetical protein
MANPADAGALSAGGNAPGLTLVLPRDRPGFDAGFEGVTTVTLTHQ